MSLVSELRQKAGGHRRLRLQAADEIERLRKIEAAARNLAWDDRGLLLRGVKELCEAFEDADGGDRGS